MNHQLSAPPRDWPPRSGKVAGLPGDEVEIGREPHTRRKVRIVGFAEVCRRWTARGEMAGGIWTDGAFAYVAEGDGPAVLVGTSSLSPVYGSAWKWFEPERVGDLPHAAFWEGDLVETPDGRTLVISEVKYERLLDGGGKCPPYSVNNGFHDEDYFEGQLQLVERGNLFRHFNGMEPEFENEREEALFAYELKKWDYIQDRSRSLTEFTFETALATLEADAADMFVIIDGSRMGWLDGVTCVRLHDRDLAERCRPAFIEEMRSILEVRNEARMTP